MGILAKIPILSAGMALLLCSSPVVAQVDRLPPVAQSAFAPPRQPQPTTAAPMGTTPRRTGLFDPRFTSTSPHPPIQVGAPVQVVAPIASPGPPGGESPLQAIRHTTTWLVPGGAEGLGMAEFEFSAVFGFPLPTRASPLVITPGAAIRWTEGPEIVDLPSRLYDAFLDIRHIRPLSPRWKADLSIKPGVYRDFESGGDDGLRIQGRGLAVFEYSPVSTFLLGVTYLDREDVNLLPVAGWIYTPSDDWRWEILFPRPRVARRLSVFGGCEHWAYVGGEFGGGSWGVLRTSGRGDVVTLRDFRVLLGWERKHPHRPDARLEVGYVFGRQLEYISDDTEFDLDDTVLLRGGIVF